MYVIIRFPDILRNGTFDGKHPGFRSLMPWQFCTPLWRIERFKFSNGCRFGSKNHLINILIRKCFYIPALYTTALVANVMSLESGKQCKCSNTRGKFFLLLCFWFFDGG